MSVIYKYYRRSMEVAFCVFFVVASLSAFSATSDQGPWPLFHNDPQRTGESASSLTAYRIGNSAVSPLNRWNFPHLIKNNYQTDKPLTWNLGHITASPTVGPDMSLSGGNEVFVASFDQYKIDSPPSIGLITDPYSSNPVLKYLNFNLINYGAVWGINASQGATLNAQTGDWWWGYRDAQITFETYASIHGLTDSGTSGTDVSSGIYVRNIPGGDQPDVNGLTNVKINAGYYKTGLDPFSFREFQFFRMVSRAIVATNPNSKDDDKPVGPIRSTPSYFHLGTSLTYSANVVTDVNDLNNLDLANSKLTLKSVSYSTKDVLVFGSDDGYVYCLDVTPKNNTIYNWTDPEGSSHSTRIANLIWRYNTQSLVNSSNAEISQYVQVISSPLLTDQIGSLGPIAVIGTGSGRVVALNLLTGDPISSTTTSYLVDSVDSTTKKATSREWAAVRTSPALYTGGSTPLVIFGADDGVVYAWDITKGSDSIAWKFATGDDFDSTSGLDRSALYNPALTASPIVVTDAEVPMIIVGATGRKDKGSFSSGINAGTVYALNPDTGKQLWSFDEWFDLRIADPTNPTDTSLQANKDAVVDIGEVRATPTFSSGVTIYGKAGKHKVAFVRTQEGSLYALYTDPTITKQHDRMAWTIPFEMGGDDAYSNEAFSSSPVITQDGTIYIGSGDGRIRGLQANGSGTILLSNNNYSAKVYPQANATWQFTTGVVAISGYNPRTGAQTYEISNRSIIATPAIAPEFLYVACDGEVFAYQDTHGGTVQVNNPFADAIGINPSQDEQPSSGSVSAEEEKNRIQTDIVTEATYRSITAATNDTTFAHTSSIATSQPGGVKWNLSQPGRVEWGDSIYVVAWNLDERVTTATLRLQGPNGTIQVLVPVSTRSTTTSDVGKRGFAKYAFVLDPYSANVVSPRGGNMANPFLNQTLTPGGDGSPTWTVVAVQSSLNSNGTTGATLSSNTVATLSKFKINNPIDIQMPSSTIAGQWITSVRPSDIDLNGNLSVPIMTFADGHHNTTTSLKTFRIGDRSDLYLVKEYNSGDGTGSLPAGASKPYLKVRIAPAELQWMGGPKAVYKPLFQSATGLQTAAPAFSTLSLASASSVEIPPEAAGRPNFSPDYPNIPSARMDFRSATNLNAVTQDIVLPHRTASSTQAYTMSYDVRIPKYQPANITPLGKGYATINPTNKFATDIMTNSSATYTPAIPSDITYLTRVFADTNLNGAADFNEAYRIFVTGTQVEVDQSLDVVEETVDLPGPSPNPNVPTPPGIAHGYVPYIGYNLRLGTTSDSSRLQRLEAESPFYQPVTILNTGNVNLWNVRMAKSSIVSPLTSSTVDPNVIQSGTSTSSTGVISASNFQSTLDPDPNLALDNPFGWIPVEKPRVNAPQGNRLQMIDPFSGNQFQSLVNGVPVSLYSSVAADTRARISVAVPLGTPVGRYASQPVFFEDGIFEGQPGTGQQKWLVDANGKIDSSVKLSDGSVFSESTTKKTWVTADVMEARATGFLSSVFPINVGTTSTPKYFTPASNDDPASIPNYPIQLPYSFGPNAMTVRKNTNTSPISNASPAAYRDASGNMHLIWSMSEPDSQGNQNWYLATSSLQYASPGDSNPWGWMYYQGGSGGFFDPTTSSHWWSDPKQIQLSNLKGFQVIGSPSIATDSSSGTTVLFFQAVADVFTTDSGVQRYNRLFYMPLDKLGNPSGSPILFPWDQEVSVTYPHPFFFKGINNQLRLALAWSGGAPNRWNLYLSTINISDLSGEASITTASDSKWTKPAILPKPSGLTYSVQPSPYFKAQSTGSNPYIDIVYSGFDQQNTDLYLERYTPNHTTNSNGQVVLDYTSWSSVALPPNANETVRRMTGRPSYQTRGLDWTYSTTFHPANSSVSSGFIIQWVRPNGNRLILSSPDSVDDSTGLRTYTSGDYTITADPGSGRISFTSANPGRSPLPSGNDSIVVSYTPKAMRLTTDPRADTEPIFFIDRSDETIPTTQPYRASSSMKLPAYVPRDRMWIIWRKGASVSGGGSSSTSGSGGPGAVGSTSLWYTTYRLMITLPTAIPVSQSGVPRVTVSGAHGVWTVDPGSGSQPGRIFFTEEDEGNDQIGITVTGAGSYSNLTVTWQPERSGVKNQEVQIPMKMPFNEGQVWAFKDPFSYLSPSDSNYTRLSNNGIWLFWSSSRSGYSDIYYQALSPQL